MFNWFKKETFEHVGTCWVTTSYEIEGRRKTVDVAVYLLESNLGTRKFEIYGNEDLKNYAGEDKRTMDYLLSQKSFYDWYKFKGPVPVILPKE